MATPNRHNTRPVAAPVTEPETQLSNGEITVDESATVADPNPVVTEQEGVEHCPDGSILVSLDYPLEPWPNRNKVDPAAGMTKVRVSKPYIRHMKKAEALRVGLSDEAYAIALTESLVILPPGVFDRIDYRDLNRLVTVATAQMGKS